MALSIIVQGQERIYIGESTDDIKCYIYPSTIKRSSYGITVWSEWVHAKPQLDEWTNKYYTRRKVQELIDCDGYREAPIKIVYYSKNGNIVNSYSWSEREESSKLLSPASPGTIGWSKIEETCKRYKRGY